MNILSGDKVTIEATVERYSNPAHMVDSYIILKEVGVNGSYFRDHVWLKVGKRLQGLKNGDKITFRAVAKEYLDDKLNTKIGFWKVRGVLKV